MYQLSVFIHVIATVVWIGGMLFLALVAVPATRKLPPAERGALFSALGRRFRTVGWVCIALLLISGPLNLGFRGYSWESLTSGRLFDGEFGRALAVKLILVAVMVGLSLAHDLILGPASARAMANPDAAHTVAALRRRTSWLARFNLVLGLLVVASAVALVRGLPW